MLSFHFITGTYKFYTTNESGASGCSLMPNEQYFSYIMARTSYIWWDDNTLCFVLEQHA